MATRCAGRDPVCFWCTVGDGLSHGLKKCPPDTLCPTFCVHRKGLDLHFCPAGAEINVLPPSRPAGSRFVKMMDDCQQAYRLPSAIHGLSHGLKKCPPDTFAQPFAYTGRDSICISAPAGQKLMCCRRRDRRQATVHRTVAFRWVRVPPSIIEKPLSQMG